MPLAGLQQDWSCWEAAPAKRQLVLEELVGMRVLQVALQCWGLLVPETVQQAAMLAQELGPLVEASLVTKAQAAKQTAQLAVVWVQALEL